MFKTTVFGGFNKEEVLEHIKVSEQRHQEEVEQMKLRISMLEEQLSVSLKQAQDDEELISSLRAALEARQLKYGLLGEEIKNLMKRYFTEEKCTSSCAEEDDLEGQSEG